MLLATAISKNNVPIRLTKERWQHILLTHQEIDSSDFNRFMKAISKPEIILNCGTIQRGHNKRRFRLNCLFYQ